MDLSKKRPAELREYALSPETSVDAIEAMDEMVRRLEAVDNCICWGVDCVHQAKELDKSYAEYTLLKKAQALLPGLKLQFCSCRPPVSCMQCRKFAELEQVLGANHEDGA
jgi:hypothetical protein